MNRAAWRSVRLLLIVQLGLMMGMAILCGFLSGMLALFSAFLAGLCCIVTTVAFAVIVFKRGGAQSARLIARSFYRAEAVKWLITAMLMMLIFVFIPIVAGAFFATFCVMQLSYWVMLGKFRGFKN